MRLKRNVESAKFLQLYRHDTVEKQRDGEKSFVRLSFQISQSTVIVGRVYDNSYTHTDWTEIKATAYFAVQSVSLPLGVRYHLSDSTKYFRKNSDNSDAQSWRYDVNETIWNRSDKSRSVWPDIFGIFSRTRVYECFQDRRFQRLVPRSNDFRYFRITMPETRTPIAHSRRTTETTVFITELELAKVNLISSFSTFLSVRRVLSIVRLLFEVRIVKPLTKCTPI